MLKAGICPSTVEFGFKQYLTTEKVVWLSQSSTPHWGIQSLVRYLQEEKFVIYTTTNNQIPSANIETYQLFVIEAKDRLDESLLETILNLRVQTLALIVILLENPSSAEVVHLLGHGADAVWTLNEPAHVLRARTRSLLRRSKRFNMEI